MNEFLAELYGTQENIAGEEDFEKQAAVEFLVKLAAEEGVDLDSLSDDEVAGLLEEIEKNASAETEEPQVEEEAQEKLAEADFLGRAMAHAYVDELSEIEKEASRVGKLLGHYKEVFRGAGGGLRGAGAVAKREAQRTGQAGKSFGRAVKSLVTGKAPSAATKGVTTTAKSVRGAAAKALGESAKQLAPAAVVGGAGGYGAYRLGKAIAGKKDEGKTKKSYNEAIEEAAQDRAFEMLAEAGYDVEKVAGNDIEIRALQMLEEAGYPVEWQ